MLKNSDILILLQFHFLGKKFTEISFVKLLNKIKYEEI